MLDVARKRKAPLAAAGAVFFDRDGCLNEDRGYVSRWADFHWLPGAVEAVLAVNRAGWRPFVVSNQSAIARSLCTAADVEALHRRMAADLARHGATVHAFRYCPHHPDHPLPDGTGHCRCRKPEPGMILDLMHAWQVDPARAFLVGDQERDIGAAKAAGILGTKSPPGGVLAAVRRGLRCLS